MLVKFNEVAHLNRYIKFIVSTLLLLVTVSCNDTSTVLHTKDDLNGSHIAVLQHSVSDQDFETLFPESKIIHFKSTAEFLVALSIGKCDAGVIEKKEGELLLESNYDYKKLSYSGLQTDTTLVIAHSRILPGRNIYSDGENIIVKSVHRIHRNIISDGYWLLILKGLGITLAMMLLGNLIAYIIAFLMICMSNNRILKYISEPVSYLIAKIHDVPSIVLVFFFYYVVFASVHISGIVVCSIALGIYTSGSLIKIITVHLKQIDKNQHAAAEMLGLTGWKKYRYVILPQAVKPMLPLMAGESKVLLRATTYAGYISIIDLVKVTEIIRNQTYDILVPLLLVSIIFLILSHIIVESLSAIYNKAFKYD